MNLRICRVTNALYPDLYGGHAIYCHELSMKQANIGHEITVITCRRDGLPRTEIVQPSYFTLRLSRTWMPWDSLGMKNPVLPTLNSYVKHLNCDLVDAHSHLFLTTAMAVKAARDCGKPVVTTVHGVMAERSLFVNLSQEAYIRSIGLWALRNSSMVICLTQSDMSQLIRLGIQPARIRVVPTGIDVEKFKPSDSEGNYVLWVGRCVPEKGLQHLLEAARLVISRGESIRFVLIGDGPTKRKLMRIAEENNLLGRVTFLPSRNQEEVSRWVRNCSLFVMPSLREGSPRAIVEAMASGKVVVASDLPSIRETVEHAAVLVQPRNAKALADAIVGLLENKNLRLESGRIARQLALEKFSWDSILQKIDKVYEQVLKQAN